MSRPTHEMSLCRCLTSPPIPYRDLYPERTDEEWYEVFYKPWSDEWTAALRKHRQEGCPVARARRENAPWNS